MIFTVWKYPIVPDPGSDPAEATIRMPMYSQILTVREQNGVPTMWVKLDASGAQFQEDRRFLIVGTGHLTDEDLVFGPARDKNTLTYVGTWYTASGLMRHLFEIEWRDPDE
jgi:hypothetical protein